MATASDGEEKGQLTKRVVAELKAHGKIIGGTVAGLWVIQLVNWMMGMRLDAFGIIPRTIQGLWGILFGPFLHGSWAHLIGNTGPLAVLGFMVMLRKKRDFFTVSAISALVSGIGVWLIAPANSVTVGASGVIFGLLGYLISRAVFDRKVWPIVGGVAALFAYGGALQGMFPGSPLISWQAHLFGFLGGILSAYMMTRMRVKEGAPVAKRSGERVRVPAAPPPDRLRTTVEPLKTRDLRAEAEHDADIEAELQALRRKTSRID